MYKDIFNPTELILLFIYKISHSVLDPRNTGWSLMIIVLNNLGDEVS